MRRVWDAQEFGRRAANPAAHATSMDLIEQWREEQLKVFENGQAGDRLSIILQAHLQHVLSGFQHAKPADPFIINNCCLTALAGCTGNIIAGGIVAGFDRDRIVQMVWGRIDAVIDEQIVLQGRPR